jgi:hypothetical protein
MGGWAERVDGWRTVGAGGLNRERVMSRDKCWRGTGQVALRGEWGQRRESGWTAWQVGGCKWAGEAGGLSTGGGLAQGLDDRRRRAKSRVVDLENDDRCGERDPAWGGLRGKSEEGEHLWSNVPHGRWR